MSIFNKINQEALPQHVAIIMDGNGRWALQRRMPRLQGHRSAVKAVRACVEASAELGLKTLTLYAFSTENWQRPRKEVSALMNLFFEFLEKELHTMLDNNVRFQLIGNRDGLPDFLQNRSWGQARYLQTLTTLPAARYFHRARRQLPRV